MSRKAVTFSPLNSILYKADYRCEKVVGSLEFKPGDVYSEDDVKRVLAKAAWTVTFVRPKE